MKNNQNYITKVDVYSNKAKIIISNIQPVSTNDMYIPRPPKKGGRGAYIIKSPLLRDFENKLLFSLSESLDDIIKSKLCDMILSKNCHMELFNIIPQNQYNGCDASNYIKSTEDILTKFLKVNDSNFKSVKSEKCVSNDGNWKIVINLTRKDKQVV